MMVGHLNHLVLTTIDETACLRCDVDVLGMTLAMLKGVRH